MNTVDTKFEVSCSDNSHIFGIPFTVIEERHAFMDVPILKDGRRSLKELDKWVNKVMYLEGYIEFHLHYVEVK